jgi:hypothetical protein
MSRSDNERRLLWRHRKPPTSASLFFFIRYGALVTNIPVLVFSFVTLSGAVSGVGIDATSAQDGSHRGLCIIF